jgi:hypothetical protein
MLTKFIEECKIYGDTDDDGIASIILKSVMVGFKLRVS